jgi:hypothetical protein
MNKYMLSSSLIILAGCFFLLGTTTVWGYTQDVGYIPNGTVYSCDACHFSGNYFLHDYGDAGRTWTVDLARMDSDGDGFTNGEELQDPDGTWSRGQPDPGDPGLVTNPADPNDYPAFPTATPTLPPEDTPTPTPTEDPAHTPAPPTATPSGCDITGVKINMPSDFYQPGDTCYCDAIVCNAEGMTLSGYPLFVILDVFGAYYFAPGFSSYDSYTMDFPAGESSVMVLPEFTWPPGAGTVNGVIWYGALATPDISDIFGNLGTFTFGWGT